ncbi:MAG: sulfotransferase family protein [Actinocatenispora sp.]
MLKVVGASFGRTGTSSVRVALEQLGFGPCHYMRDLFVDNEHARDWLRIAQGETPDWENLLGRWTSTIAWPATYFWRELVAAYPAAKVLLTVRDPEAWYASMARTLHRTRPPGGGGDGPDGVRDRVIEQIVWQGTFSGRFADRAYATAVYRAHLDEVRDTVPTDRLVVVDAAHGWAQLCAGLGAAPPTANFPSLNSTDEYLRRAEQAGVLPSR